MPPPIIEVQNLSKRYRLGRIGATTLRDDASRLWSQLRGKVPPTELGEFWALRDVSFSIQPGEVVGILGRNGAGKSTLLKILSRITEPSSGRAILRGRVASLLEVGTGFHPDLTGRENIFLNGAILGMKRPEITARFDEIVAFAEVAKFIDTPVKHYSSGMRVRLAFAVAAHLDSDILIADEVLAVGDTAFQEKCLGKIRELSVRQNRTILFVSHQTNAILALCPQALWMEQGALMATGRTKDLLDQYMDAHVVKAVSVGLINIIKISPDHPASVGKHFILQSFCLRPAAALPSDREISILAPLDFEICLEATEPVQDAFVVLSLWLQGVCVFSHPSPLRHVERGRHLYTAHLPGKLLNHETYTVNIYVKSRGVGASYENLMNFKPADGGKPAHVELEKWVGVVRPEIGWTLGERLPCDA